MKGLGVYDAVLFASGAPGAFGGGRTIISIEALAQNIREIGLLQPIGVDKYFTLICGARRLEACEILGWKEIPCVVLDLKSIIAGEYAENEFRKQFTKSERAAIAKAVEDELNEEERRGNPQFTRPGAEFRTRRDARHCREKGGPRKPRDIRSHEDGDR
jgi:hypothetical protein